MATVHRMQAYRERKRAGLVMLSIEVDQADVAEMLERAELLPEHEVHSRQQITEALELMVARLCEWPA